MKKGIFGFLLIMIIVLAIFSSVVILLFDCNPFLDIMAEIDYKKNKEFFENIVFECKDETTVITKENYDSSSKTFSILFEEMNYEFVRISKDYVFFCKGYDGMSGIGIMYLKNGNYTPFPKEYIRKILGNDWVIFSENYL